MKVPRNVSFTRGKPPIASPLEELPSPVAMILSEGLESPRVISALAEDLWQFHGHNRIAEPLRPIVADWNLQYVRRRPLSAEERQSRRARLLQAFRDYFAGVRVVDTLGTRHIFVPLTELHRPKASGCNATIKVGYSKETEYSFEVSVLSLGGGASKRKRLGFDDEITTNGNCLGVDLAASVVWEKCENRAGVSFIRPAVLDITTNLRLRELKSARDGCRYDPQRIENKSWITEFEVPPRISWIRSLSLESGTTSEFGLGPSFAGATFRLKASVSLVRTFDFEFALRGPKVYTALRTPSAMTYCWNWGRRPRAKT